MEEQQTAGSELCSEDCRTDHEDARDAATASTAKRAATAAHSDRRPNWNKWMHVVDVAVWEAVALSLDIDPERVVRATGAEVGFAVFRESLEFEERLFVAVRHLGIGKRLSIVSPGTQNPPLDATIDLKEFVAWAPTIPWRLPVTLVRFFGDDDPNYVPQSDPYWDPEPASSTVASGWPWGDYDTNLLRLLAAAVRRFWSLYDPGDPSTAPTNEMVVEWLMTQDVPRRTAEVMATILRADGLRTGRRKK